MIATLVLALVAACGGSGDEGDSGQPPAPPGSAGAASAGNANAADPTPTTVDAGDPDESTAPSEVAAPATTEPPGVEPIAFETAFEACVGSAGIGYSDQVASLLTPPTGQPVRWPNVEVAPAAIYGPETGIWWAVFVAADPQDREFLTAYLPTNTSYQTRGRVILARGAIDGWTDDGTMAAADLAPEQQAQLAPIATCVLEALAHDQALSAATLDPNRPATVDLHGTFMEIECVAPDCQILANETHFTVPAGGAAGELNGTAVYTIQFPAADGPPGCTNTLTRSFTYTGTVGETPEGTTTIGSAGRKFWEAFESGLTGPDDPAWPGRVLADGTLHLVRTVTPEGCVEGADLEMALPEPLVGYYGPNEQILSAVWAVGVNEYGNPEIDYLWAAGEL